VTLRQAGGIDAVLQRSELKRLINSNRSLMPPGLEAGLTVQQMADLLEYLKSPGGN
jgi:putative heme-binding domain-containing protein